MIKRSAQRTLRHTIKTLDHHAMVCRSVGSGERSCPKVCRPSDRSGRYGSG
jgi:hypothetical protein